MRCSIGIVITSWILCMGHFQGVGAQSSSTSLEDIRRALSTVAETLPTFETEDLIYNRWPRLARTVDGTYGNGLPGLVEANYDVDRLVQLLDDIRPAVRTLALALLFSKEDPNLLTHIARHLGDTARTFPVLLPTANADPTRTAPQTVGDVAKAMLGAYMLAAGMKEWRDPQLDDWLAYSTSHRNRPYCLSWLIVRLSRVTGMQSPFPEDRRPMLLKFRNDLDRLPPGDRDLYLLWLCHGNATFDGGRVLATEEELVDAAKRLGRQKVLQIVDGRPPGTDTDVPANLDRYQAVNYFILSHADRLFTRADEPFLAAIEQGQRDKIARGANAALEVVQVQALGRARAMLRGEAR